MKKLEITTEFIKLDQCLKLAGFVSSGSEAKMLILGGEVSVNGNSCTMRGKKCYPRDIVTVNALGSLEIVR